MACGLSHPLPPMTVLVISNEEALGVIGFINPLRGFVGARMLITTLDRIKAI